MDQITHTHVAAIIGQATDERVEGSVFRSGHETDHCFVTLTSGKQLVIRFAQDAPENWHWTIERFVREDCAGEIYARETGLAAPRTLFIDSTGTIVDAVYAIQTFVNGRIFRQVFKSATDEERVNLLRRFGEAASRIHAIELPPYRHDPVNEHLVQLVCSPVRARCPASLMDIVVDRLDPEYTGSTDHADCLLSRTSFYRAVFTSNSRSAFHDSIERGIRTLREDGRIRAKSASSLSGLFERNWEAIERHLDLRNFCHGDYHFANIMVDRDSESSDWRIVGIFDLDMPQVSCPIEDFGKAEEFDFPGIQLPGYRRHVLEGYGNSLSPLEYGLLTLGSLLSHPERLGRAPLLIGETEKPSEDTLLQALFEA